MTIATVFSAVLVLMLLARPKYAWVTLPTRDYASRLSKSLQMSSNPVQPDYSNEETLLRLALSVNEGADRNQARKELSKYCQSFPFAVVLPVQPLMYIPTDQGGVEIRFLRKKTAEKSSVDGGICFFIDADTLEVTAKRNSLGQSVPKMFAEKLVITNFVAGIAGDDDRFGSPPSSIQIKSVFHPWMDAFLEGKK